MFVIVTKQVSKEKIVKRLERDANRVLKSTTMTNIIMIMTTITLIMMSVFMVKGIVVFMEKP